MNTTTNTTATARRITVKGKIVIETTLPDGTVRLDGGKIAERATAAIVIRWQGESAWSLAAHRSDFAKAQAEAAAYLAPPRRGSTRTITAAEALVLIVTD
jgi:hypothetical protein